MKKLFKQTRNQRAIILFAMAFALGFEPVHLYAQDSIRSYATRQATIIGGVINLLSSTSNSSDAVDNSPKTASTLSVAVGLDGYVEQILDFNPSPSATGSYTNTISAGTPITIKFSLPSGLLSALNGLEIQAVTGLNQTGNGTLFSPYIWNYSDVSTSYNGSNLASLISGAGEVEVTITPTVAFQGIRIRAYGVLAALYSINVYDAYIKVPTTPPIACSERIDVLAGVMAGAVVGGIANATGGVTNEWNTIDNDTTTYAAMRTGADALSQVYLTTVFNSPSKGGDSVILIIQAANNPIIDLSALSGLSINIYNEDSITPTETLTNLSSLLHLSILDASSGIVRLAFVPNAVFDRVQIVLGGLATALEGLNVYDVNRENAGATLTAAQADIYIYAGQPYTLSASSITNDSIVYYDAPSGGMAVSDEPTPTVLRTTDTVLHFYASTIRNGCTENSVAKQINVHIIGFTNNQPDSGQVNNDYSSDVIVTPPNPLDLPVAPGYQYSITGSLPPGLTLNPTNGMITGTPTDTGTYVIVVAVTDTANKMPVGTFNDTIPVTTLQGTSIQNNPLPVKLSSFTCSGNQQQIDLLWTTLSENDNAGFDVQKSLDGRNFVSLGFVKSNYVEGTGTKQQHYVFTDLNPNSGVNYYRLNQLDLDKTSTYSTVISWYVNNENGINIYPNPANGILHIRANKNKGIYIFNALGQLVAIPKVNEGGETTFNTENLADGAYYIKVITPSSTQSTTIVVNH